MRACTHVHVCMCLHSACSETNEDTHSHPSHGQVVASEEDSDDAVDKDEGEIEAACMLSKLGCYQQVGMRQ